MINCSRIAFVLLAILSIVKGSLFRQLKSNSDGIHAIPSQNALQCSIHCQNRGTCSLVEHTHHNTLPQRCSCPPGYGGLQCEIPMNSCFTRFGEDYYCQAGSPCLLSASGDHFCDCSQAYTGSAFAGLNCVFSATEYCTDDASISFRAFCTNGGACMGYVQDDSVDGHPGCSCTSGFNGDHCEYLDGKIPMSEQVTASSTSSKEKKMSSLDIFLIIFFLGAFITCAASVWRSWYQRKHTFIQPDYDYE